MTRYEANLEIIERLHSAVEQNKDARFGQLLVNCSVIPRTDNPGDTCDIFHEESLVILKRMEELMKVRSH